MSIDKSPPKRERERKREKEETYMYKNLTPNFFLPKFCCECDAIIGVIVVVVLLSSSLSLCVCVFGLFV
jgi:hypothetical protein